MLAVANEGDLLRNPNCVEGFRYLFRGNFSHKRLNRLLWTPLRLPNQVNHFLELIPLRVWHHHIDKPRLSYRLEVNDSLVGLHDSINGNPRRCSSYLPLALSWLNISIILPLRHYILAMKVLRVVLTSRGKYYMYLSIIPNFDRIPLLRSSRSVVLARYVARVFIRLNCGSAWWHWHLLDMRRSFVSPIFYFLKHASHFFAS